MQAQAWAFRHRFHRARTTTPDQVFPSTACLVAGRLGIAGPPASKWRRPVPASFYALSIADKFIRLSEAKCALVIGAEWSEPVGWIE